MANYSDFDLSELEQEFELDTSPDSDLAVNESISGDEELEPDPEAELLFEFEDSLDSAAEFELDDEFELVENSELDGPAAAYGERFFELAERNFEGSADPALNEILDEMGRDYFLGGLVRRIKKGVPGLRKLVGKGLQLAKAAGVQLPMIDALKNASGLAQNLLQGNLAGVAKHALSAALKAYPGTAAAAPILSTLGFEANVPEKNREAWHNFAEVARESYEYLADNFNETSIQPDKAIQLSQQALQHGLQQAKKRIPQNSQRGSMGSLPGKSRKVRVVRLAPGERLLIISPRHGS